MFLHNIRSTAIKTSLSRSTIYRLVAEGKFPNPVKISARRIGWRESDLDEFIANLK